MAGLVLAAAKLGMSEFLIITGVSGAGRSQAADTFEDLGWFVIDNLPPALIGKVAELVQAPGATTERVALVVGTGHYLDEVTRRPRPAAGHAGRVRVLFLEASDEVLVRRFENTRRRHPLAESERVTDGIERERALLDPVKSQADVVVDTSDLNVHQLRDRLLELFGNDAEGPMQTSVVSFGYKHGLPLDVDLVFDCRFLPNPHWVEALRPLTGLDAAGAGVRGQPARDARVPGQARRPVRPCCCRPTSRRASPTCRSRSAARAAPTGRLHRRGAGQAAREAGLPADGLPPRPREVARRMGSAHDEGRRPGGRARAVGEPAGHPPVRRPR